MSVDLTDRLRAELVMRGMGLDSARFGETIGGELHLTMDVTSPTLECTMKDFVGLLGEVVALAYAKADRDVAVTVNALLIHGDDVQQRIKGIRFHMERNGYIVWPVKGDQEVTEGPVLRTFAHTFQAFVWEA